MKRENGFSLIELMVSMAVTIIVLGAATTALLQAQKATQAIADRSATSAVDVSRERFGREDQSDCLKDHSRTAVSLRPASVGSRTLPRSRPNRGCRCDRRRCRERRSAKDGIGQGGYRSPRNW